MAKVTGKLIDSNALRYADGVAQYANPGDTVTIELKRGYKVIGKREECEYRGNKKNRFYIYCQLAAGYINKMNCPCHNWKPRKEPK